MALDAGMLACSLHEIKQNCTGARVEKIYQPENDEIILNLRSASGSFRLLINAGSNNPRTGLTSAQKENPQNPPMFCMLLRKHLQGAKLADATQAGFDRVLFFEFDSYDELGFETKKYLVAEMMGKYSNLIFANGDMKIVSALRMKDFSLDSKRQLLPGAAYALPPSQGKSNPLECSRENFAALFAASLSDRRADKFITDSFSGISPAVSREIVFRVSGKADALLCEIPEEALFAEFDKFRNIIKKAGFSPCIVFDKNKPVEYSFMPFSHYVGFEIREFTRASALFDCFFETRDNEQRIRQRAADLTKLLSHARARLEKKIAVQLSEITQNEEYAVCKKYGDLITANIWMLKKGDREALLPDYENADADGNCPMMKIELDPRLTPAQNAQKYYKKYSKSKTARVELAKQIEIAKEELEYLNGVADSLTRAESASDLLEIRDELARAGFASKMKSYSVPKKHNLGVMQFETPGGFKVLCGKNNLQNDHITHKIADGNDFWFHVKGNAGSHAVLITDGKTPQDEDFTAAAKIAAFYSKSSGKNIAVDYTQVKNLKKPSGAKPGFVIYRTNYTAYVRPTRQKLRQ